MPINHLRTNFLSVRKDHIPVPSWLPAPVSQFGTIAVVTCALTDVPRKRGCDPQALYKAGYGSWGGGGVPLQNPGSSRF